MDGTAAGHVVTVIRQLVAAGGGGAVVVAAEGVVVDISQPLQTKRSEGRSNAVFFFTGGSSAEKRGHSASIVEECAEASP